MGQWAIAASGLNGRVDASDVNAERIAVARALAVEHDVTNVDFRVAPMEQLPLADGCADAVFCYCAFMFASMTHALHEFRRVLRPRGRVYLNANARGWYAHLLVDRGIRRRETAMVKQVLLAASRSLRRRDRGRIVGEGWLRRRLAQERFRVVGLGVEGT